MEKGKLQHNGMVKKLMEKGVSFDIVTREQAELFLKNNNYYYKITSYRKNYPKVDGKYVDLDFAYLLDLSSIDMRLRYHIMKMALDIEHSLKTLLLKIITNNIKEDGYSIVQEFKQFDPNNHRRTMSIFKISEYLSDMYQKRGNDVPVFVFVEIMDYGTLSKFIAFYRTKYIAKDLKVAHILLPYSKHLRNLAAHSNTLLVNIYGDENLLRDTESNVRVPSAEVVSYAEEFEISREDVKYNKIHDLVSLFKLHKQYASTAIQSSRAAEYAEILERISRNKVFYESNPELTNFFSILHKLNS